VTTAASARRSEFEGSIQVFEPHRASLPPVRPYLREFWRRRRFAYELSRTTQKAANFDSPIGSVWLVLNPLLLAFVYFLLIEVISGGTKKGASGWASFLHIVIGLFSWTLVSSCMSVGATSVTAGGKLILNQSFPRALLPFSSVITSLMNYLPTLPVYLVMYGIGLIFLPHVPPGQGSTGLVAPTWALAWHPVLVVLLAVTGFGLAMIFSTMTVYFRDTTKFLSYVLRIWLYLSPVLYTVSAMVDKYEQVWPPLGKIMIYGNPLGPVLGVMNDIWIEGVSPTPSLLGGAILWAVFLLVFGGWLFVSRERDFAVRL
jgi:teichoic acid transport system permease protein